MSRSRWHVYTNSFKKLQACVQNIRHQHASMLSVMHAACQWMRRWRIVQWWAKCLTDAVTIWPGSRRRNRNNVCYCYCYNLWTLELKVTVIKCSTLKVKLTLSKSRTLELKVTKGQSQLHVGLSTAVPADMVVVVATSWFCSFVGNFCFTIAFAGGSLTK